MQRCPPAASTRMIRGCSADERATCQLDNFRQKMQPDGTGEIWDNQSQRVMMNAFLWVLQALAGCVYGSSGVMKVFFFDKVNDRGQTK
jgi:hypothetical protein